MSAKIPQIKPGNVYPISKIEGNPRSMKGIFIYAEAGAVFQGLVHSLERTFANITIHLSSKFVEIEAFDNEIGLVLVNTGFVSNLSECTARCRKRFPNASITMMIDDSGALLDELASLFDDQLIQGLLPFSLKLDIWLAVIWLLLNGGEYGPSAIIRSSENASGRAGVQENQLGEQIKNSPDISNQVKMLTSREHQILDLISLGLQNKNIADRLKLSEHTVKVHVHNLIRKLRVHNRTHAAAVYRNNKEREAYSGPLKGYQAPVRHVEHAMEIGRVA